MVNHRGRYPKSAKTDYLPAETPRDWPLQLATCRCFRIWVERRLWADKGNSRRGRAGDWRAQAEFSGFDRGRPLKSFGRVRAANRLD